MASRNCAALVVGGASGIGLATAANLVAKGHTVVLLDRNANALENSANRLSANATAEIHTHVVDITDLSTLDQVVHGIEDRMGISILINAAGILQLGTVHDVTEGDWDRMIDINLKGVFLACKVVMPVMERCGGGTVVNVASQSGRTKSTYSAPNYVAAKAGVIGLTMVLANQAAAAGIRVNCVAPGLVETPMLSAYTPDQRQRMTDAVPMGRFAQPEEVADVIAYLASSQSSYVTGQTINVNGGSYM